jgi:hypothetical protein
MRSTDIALIITFTVVFATAEFAVVMSALPNNSIISTWISFLPSSAIIVGMFMTLGAGLVWDSRLPRKAILNKVTDDKISRDKERWLKLQVIFQHITIILIIVGVLNAMIGAGLSHGGGEYYFLSMFVVPVLVFLYLHGARYVLGMGYSELYCSSITGAKALSMLASNQLKQKNNQGISYLLKSLNLFEEVLKQKGIVSEDLNEVYWYVSTIKTISNELPYDELIVLASGLSELNSLVDITEPLRRFTKEDKIAKLRAFGVSSHSKRLFLERVAIAVAVASAFFTGVLTLIPEDLKGQIVAAVVNIIETPDSISAITFIVAMFLFLLVGVYLFERITRAFIHDEDIGWKYLSIEWLIGETYLRLVSTIKKVKSLVVTLRLVL